MVEGAVDGLVGGQEDVVNVVKAAAVVGALLVAVDGAPGGWAAGISNSASSAGCCQ